MQPVKSALWFPATTDEKRRSGEETRGERRAAKQDGYERMLSPIRGWVFCSGL